MSANIVSHGTINVILGFAAYRRDALRFTLADGQTLNFDNPDDLQRAAELLVGENHRNLAVRYEGRYDTSGPAIMFAYSVIRQGRPQPVPVLKLCDYYDYQSCDTADYPTTDAARLVDRIRHMAIDDLPGYTEAPWGLP